MSIETPEHWTGETRRLAEGLATQRMDYRMTGQLAIAAELAELRKVLEPTETVMSIEARELPAAALEELIKEHAAKSGVPTDLLPKEHETSGFALHRAMPEDQRTHIDLLSITGRGAGIKQVGWYCPGGHPGENGQPVPSNLRFEDPCVYAVPMYVLVK